MKPEFENLCFRGYVFPSITEISLHIQSNRPFLCIETIKESRNETAGRYEVILPDVSRKILQLVSLLGELSLHRAYLKDGMMIECLCW